ncbi:tripartite tricarboxylate transporter substrate-binding protein [Roseomonas sp. GC11]|uniref:Bug family tripartite tricarboxylate transporter substrate binding protein n=1 Tax=Roseomonas sp. GC11 TaxID=2950546 RepID=UPI00210E3D72|nr:tripartite tricarboxylate transporter substrate-binding protein [Roseomonas sp. GC11]MCQ4158571.1 tripartite tricarboxylate transporter substrate-binding protein [Roseomonas sp. GC11]
MPHLPRRALLGAVALPFLARRARAAAWPSRPVRVIVPFAAGGTTDIAAHILADHLRRRLGEPFRVENRPGAAGNLGADHVARAEPDGHTLLMQGPSSGAINHVLYGAAMPFRPEALASIGLLMRVPNIILTSPGLPARTLTELVVLAKRRPGQLTIGSSGFGTTLHMTGELLKVEAGLQLSHLPFRGAAPMLEELAAERVDVAVDNLPSALRLVREKKIRPLAVTCPARCPALPGVPTTAEAGLPRVEATAWFGLQAPAATPRGVIDTLNAELNSFIATPASWGRLAEMGALKPGLTPGGGTSPAAFDAFLAAEMRKWAEVARRSGTRVN